MTMQISEVQIKPTKPRDGLIGFASLVINKSLYLSSIGIFTRLNGQGYRITYPTKKVGSLDMQVFHPISKELGKEIEKEVIKKAEDIFNENT